VQAQQESTIFNLFYPGLGIADYTKTRRDAYGVLDLRLGVEGKSWSLTAFMSNALNKKYLSEIIPSPEFGGAFLSPGDRRLIGVELGWHF
jgi:iron complex outermembrane receptor protein